MLNKHQTIRKQAAKWFTRMQNAEVDHPDRSEFEAWLMQSNVHSDEYLAICAVWDDFDSTPKLQSLADAMTLKQFELKTDQKVKSKKLVNLAGKAVIVLFISALSLFGFQEWQTQPTMSIARNTAIAKIMKQELEDGSKLTLNANTEVEVTYYRNKRLVKLNRGEAIFEVVKDSNRPFIVESQMVKVTVLGTRFVVNQLNGRAFVSVDHGRVRVEAAEGKGNIQENAQFETVILTNGQVAEVKAGSKPMRIQRTAADAFAFAEGRLIFDGASLSEIAESLSRYRKIPVIAVNKLAHQVEKEPRITAVLNITEIESFLQSLPRIAAVKVVQTNHQTQLISQ